MIKTIANNGNPLLLFPGEITLFPGINLLGGGNGVGKSTLLGELRHWARSKGYFDDSNKIERAFLSEKQLKDGAVAKMRIKITEEGETNRCFFWQNSKDNRRYTKADPWGDSGAYCRDAIDAFDAQEHSEGENVVESFLRWVEGRGLRDGDVVLVDEVDSGLSVDACNGIIHYLLDVVSKVGVQVVLTCNSFHFPYVVGSQVCLLDGMTHFFDGSYERFCEYSYGNARKLVPIREAARKRERRAQAADARKRKEKFTKGTVHVANRRRSAGA